LFFNHNNTEKDLVKAELGRAPGSTEAHPSPLSSKNQTLITDYFIKVAPEPEDTNAIEELEIWGDLNDEECLAMAESTE
jgi:hypothetical protein